MTTKAAISDVTNPACSHVTVDPKVLYVGTPVALITTMSPDGTCNIGPMSSAWALGHTIVLGWEATSQTLANLEREGECVINYPDASRWAQVDAIATLTGHNPPAPHKVGQFTYSADKWVPGEFTPQKSALVTPPRIRECPIQCEADVVAVHRPRGTDGAGFRIVETRVRTIHADQRILAPGSNHIDTNVWEPLLYVFRDYFGTGTFLGKTHRR
jgi:flavin reductase (DIM6/NTAB) family NADH-FMN oxidoreductase RutF